jgi:hypothetical protein
MRIMRRLGRLCLASLLAAGGLPAAADGQGNSAERHRVSVIEVASLPLGNVAMAFHRAAGDVVALSPAATGRDLGAALRALEALRAQPADAHGGVRAAAVNSETAPSDPKAKQRASEREKLHDAFVLKLRRSPVSQVSGFGAVKVLELNIRERPARAGS